MLFLRTCCTLHGSAQRSCRTPTFVRSSLVAVLLVGAAMSGCNDTRGVPQRATEGDTGENDERAGDDVVGDEADTTDETRPAALDASQAKPRDAGAPVKDSGVGAARDGTVAPRERDAAPEVTTPVDESDAATADGGGPAPLGASCASLPTTDDYAAKGPFADAKVFTGVGPNKNYTLYRPDGSLGRDGFRHPIAVWGNGIATTPDHYTQTLTLIASHGWVVIACNDTMAERPCLDSGIAWLIEQDAASGALQGKLDTSNEATIGYSWGGGAAIDAANRPNVKTTVSLHGMPPRASTAFADMHAPLLLFTSTGDGFVTASGYVTPNYEKSKVKTFYATLEDAQAGHLYVVDKGATACAVSAALGTCEGAIAERAPVVAWLRMWQCGDEHAKTFFEGDDCVLCKKPWITPKRKNW